MKTVAEGLTMMLFLIWMIVYGIIVRGRVQGEDEEVSKKSLFRINVVLCACLFSACLRLLALAILLSPLKTGFFESENFDNIEWFIFSQWLPTIVPVRTIKLMR